MRYNANRSTSVFYTRLHERKANTRKLLNYIIAAVATVSILVFFSVWLWRRLQVRHHLSQTSNSTMKIKCITCDENTTDAALSSTLSFDKNLSILSNIVNQSGDVLLPETTIIPEMTTMENTMSNFKSYINRTVYIQSVDHPNRYLTKNGTNWGIYLLPFSSDTTVFIVRPCLWQLFKETYSNFTCISLESADGEPGKYVLHDSVRVYVEILEREQRSNFVGNASFLLVGDEMKFQLRSTIAMQIDTILWLRYHLPNFAVYMRTKYQNGYFHYFRFVLQ